jgi:hypothetical protein
MLHRSGFGIEPCHLRVFSRLILSGLSTTCLVSGQSRFLKKDFKELPTQLGPVVVKLFWFILWPC